MAGFIKPPHFACGPLDKQQYEQAHVMHFYNHLEEMKRRVWVEIRRRQHDLF